ncbi:MAG: efflux RND transporter periplasmic adaptor subunit, partial [Chloroflexota bacterium]
IDTLRTQTQQALTDLSIYGTSDVNSARNALNTADGALANAQVYASGLLAGAMSEHTASRDTLQATVAQFDAAIASGADTSPAQSAYQTAHLNYNVTLAKLQSAIDTVSTQVASAQTSLNSALASLNSATSRPITTFDTARTSLGIAQASFTTQNVALATARTKLTQAATPLGTMADAVGGALLNATTALTSAQDRAATTLRNAQSAVANIPFNLQSAQVSVDNANNAVATATSNLDNAVLTAPAAGIVASIANQVGEFVAGGNTNNAFMVLTNTTTMMLHGTIGESDVAKLKLGQVANITVEALGGARMTGKIASLDPVATISQGVPVYGIDIAIDVPAAGLRAGMSASGAVILARKRNVLIVPNTVIRTVAGRRGVQVLKDGVVVDATVQFGVANERVTEVSGGLAEGDMVVFPSARP